METIPYFRSWKYVRHIFPKKDDKGVVIPGLSGDLYTRGKGKEMDSAVLHCFKGKRAFIAWGKFHAKHCGAYAVWMKSGKWSRPVLGCPDLLYIKKKGKIIGFSLLSPRTSRAFR